MATISKTMRALKSKAAGQIELDAAASVPALKPTYVLVKVHAVALNPTDWKSIDRLQDPGFTVGCDYSGTVVAIGEQVTKSLTPGDRVAGFVHGAKATAPDSGAFAEYAAAKGDVQMKMPPHISDEEAATVGIGVSTVGQGLYQSLGLPWPNKPVSDGTFVLIYGGSTATGIFAIQFAKLSGLRVITTCSPKNAEFVKKLGAEEAFDYRDADACGKKIWEYTGDKLKYAFDCISEGSSAKVRWPQKCNQPDPAYRDRADLLRCSDELGWCQVLGVASNRRLPAIGRELQPHACIHDDWRRDAGGR